MNNLYNKIYNAVNEGIIKSLYIDDENNDKVTYQHNKTNIYLDPLTAEFVDLGLPSGTLWCDHNLGATCESNPESWYGDYYAWSEIETKKIYSYASHNKYNKAKLDMYHDVAKAKYSKIKNSKIAKSAKMPTKKQCMELLEYTNNRYVENYKGIIGLNGKIFIGLNKNSIFIPFTGKFADDHINHQDAGQLWSSNKYETLSNQAYSMYFDLDGNILCGESMYIGLPVRPVYKK